MARREIIQKIHPVHTQEEHKVYSKYRENGSLKPGGFGGGWTIVISEMEDLLKTGFTHREVFTETHSYLISFEDIMLFGEKWNPKHHKTGNPVKKWVYPCSKCYIHDLSLSTSLQLTLC